MLTRRYPKFFFCAFIFDLILTLNVHLLNGYFFRLKSVMTKLRPLSLEKVAHGNVTNLKVAAKQTGNQNQVS